MVDCLPQCSGTDGGLSALVQWMVDCLFSSAVVLMVDCLFQCNGTDGGLTVSVH